MEGGTFICLRSEAPDMGWTVFHLTAEGKREAVLCFRHYLEAARMLKFLRASRAAMAH